MPDGRPMSEVIAPGPHRALPNPNTAVPLGGNP